MQKVIWLAAAVLAWGASAQAAPFAYVPGSASGGSTLTIVDTATDSIVTTVPIVKFAQSAAVTSDGSTVYFGSIDDDDVTRFDAFTNTVSGTQQGTAGFPTVTALAVNPAGTRLYTCAASGIGVVDLTTNTFVTEVTAPGVIQAPSGVVVTPDGAKVYATNVFSGAHVVAIDAATNTVVQSIPATGSRGIDVHPDGSKVYAADNVAFPHGVSVIDTATDTLITKIPLSNVGAVRVHPDGSKVYAAGNNFVAIINTATNTVSSNLAAAGLHFGIDLNPAATKIYLPVHSGSLEVRDATTLGLITSIPVTGEPFARGRFVGPAFACGNGTHEPGEECDDGNLANGDCCSSTCTLETCDDGNGCTVDTCVAPLGCVFAPPTCRTAEKSILLLKDKSDDTKDKFLWKWIKGQSTTLAEFGDPTATTDYTLCLYAGTTSTTAADLQVPAGTPQWAAAGSKGWKYKFDAGTPDGIQKMTLKSSDQDKAKVIAKGKGTNLPDLALDTLPTPILVQLLNDETAACWEATFQAGDVSQDAGKLKGKRQD